MEQRSEHPLARAIVRHALARGLAVAPAQDFTALPGAGASATVEGQRLTIGSPDLFAGYDGDTCARDAVSRMQGEGKTVVAVGRGKTVEGIIALRDSPRANAKAAVSALRAAGIEHVVMLTGDSAAPARRIADLVGIDDVFADLKPADKLQKIRDLVARYGHVAMVGDGVNDAPALAAASLGVTLGAAGTDVALETADVALMGDDLGKLAYGLRLAQRNQAIVRQNLALSGLVISVLVAGAVAGLLTLPMAVVGHEVSEWFVIANGMRMLRS
jgi:Cd2+/Zn2+-exporting ATPase